MTKVLHLIPSLGSGGAERQLSRLAPALAASGLNVHVAYVHAGPNLPALAGAGVECHCLTHSGNHSPALAWQIYTLVRRLRPDVVQTWILQMDVLGGVAALACGVPLIVSERSSAALYPPSWKVRARLAVGRRANAIVANSVGGLDYWRPFVKPARLHLIRNALETQGAPSDTPVTREPLVIYAGRFSFEKNIETLLAGLMAAARLRPELQFALFGDGPLLGWAQSEIAAAGLCRQIQTPGYCGDLRPWMQRAALCVSMSHFEGNPNVVLEAAAAGCPMILSDIPAHREIFNESHCLWTPTQDSAALTQALLRILDEPGLAQQRALRAREVTDAFSLEAAVDAYAALYGQLALREPHTGQALPLNR